MHNLNLVHVYFFFFNDTATTEIYTLSLHDALPISGRTRSSGCRCGRTSRPTAAAAGGASTDRKSTRLNSSHGYISYAVFCLKKKKSTTVRQSRLENRAVSDRGLDTTSAVITPSGAS